MVIKILLLLVALASTISATDLEWFHWKDNDAISFGGFVPEMRAVKAIVGEGDEAPRIVYGDRHGAVYVLEMQGGRFREVWRSPPLRAEIAEVFVLDIDVDDELEIVAYTHAGDIAVLSCQRFS